MPLHWIELGRVIGSYWILKLRVYMGLPLGYHWVYIVLRFLEQKMANYDRSKSSQMVFDGSVEEAVI